MNTGTGARLLSVIRDAGIEWKVVRVWNGADRTVESRLKHTHDRVVLCPVCGEERRKVKLKQRQEQRKKERTKEYMTLNGLSNAFELMEEIGPESVGYAYRRTTGETIYAVFTDESKNDLDYSPEVLAYVPLETKDNCDNHDFYVYLLNVSLGIEE